MPVYDSPLPANFKVLTHTNQGRNYAKNGYSQVGNKTIPTQEISQYRVAPSAIYNRGIPASLKYAGGGSPRATFLAYAGAGSPRNSLSYPGAGSPKASFTIKGISEAGYGQTYPNPRGLSRMSRPNGYRPGARSGLRYAGAGSPKNSVLRDAYINDNPPPGTLKGLSQSGLADDPTDGSNTTVYGPNLPGGTIPPPSGSLWTDLQNALSTITTGVVQSAASAGQAAATNAVTSAITGTPSTTQQLVTSVKAATNPKTIMGFSIDAIMLAGAGVAAFMILKKK